MKAIIFNIPISIIAIMVFVPVFGQYQSVPAKEEYDFYNSIKINIYYRPCVVGPNNDADIFGDGMSKILEGYISMYAATSDKAYLYKFVMQSMCMVENRQDLNSEADNSEPRWSFDPQMYQDGYILAALSRFVYFVKIEVPYLYYEEIYPFNEIDPLLYSPNTCNCNSSGITFQTLGQYADWLQARVGETLWWYLTNGYWRNAGGMYKTPDSESPAELNMQIGFGRALLFMGLATGEQSFLDKADRIAGLMKGNVTIVDPCEEVYYSTPVLRLTPDNSYWWYHFGWRVGFRDCGNWSGLTYHYYYNVPDYDEYTSKIEDISHGAVVTWLPLDFYHFQPNSTFTTDDMIRFRNMFTKHISDGTGGFHEAVNGQDEPVDPPGELDIRSLNYMPFTEFDGADATASYPDVYDIIFDYYVSQISGNIAPPSDYTGQDNKGHAEIVLAQWERECPNLTLFNRHVVYNQDFFAKGDLTIAPGESMGDSYAEPIIWEKTFTVNPGVSATFTSGSEITLKDGVNLLSGSYVVISVDQNLCNGEKIKIGNPIVESNSDNTARKVELNSEVSFQSDTTACNIIFEIAPNPISSNSVIRFSVPHEGLVSLMVYDISGQVVLIFLDAVKIEKGLYMFPVSLQDLSSGVYTCVFQLDQGIKRSKKIIVE